MTECCVYWIHLPDHTDIIKEGYVGVTKKFDHRMYCHKTSATGILKKAIAKHGWENLIVEKQVIASEDYCYALEERLRPEERIGWNTVIGGGNPPTQAKPVEFNGVNFSTQIEAAEYFGVSRGTIKRRLDKGIPLDADGVELMRNNRKGKGKGKRNAMSNPEIRSKHKEAIVAARGKRVISPYGEFNSIQEASEQTPLSYKQVYTRCNGNKEGWTYGH